MQNKLDNFDQMLKDMFDGYESPLNEMHWEELEEELNIVTPGMTGYFSAITTGLVATSMVFMAMLFFVSDANYSPNEIEQEEIVLSGNGQSGNTGIAESKDTQNAATYSVEESDAANTNGDDISTTTEDVNTEVSSEMETNQSSRVEEKGTVESSESTSVAEANSASNINSSNTTSEEDNTVVASSVESEEASNIRTGCTGLTIDFDASEEYGANAKYLWNFGDGYFSNEATPSHTFNKEGTFDVSLSVTSAESGQITSNVVQAMIEIVEAPIANMDIEIESANAITLHNKSFNANDVEWRIDGSTQGNGASISLSVADNTNYELKLAALNVGGCVDTLDIDIRSIEAGSEFPRAFETSYGHSFAPGAIIDEGNVSSVKIYNLNSGELVFEGSGNKGWNGNLPNGEKADKGTYQWMMAVEQDASIDVYHGDLELR